MTAHRLSDALTDPEGTRFAEAVRRAVLDVLPDACQVLPDGRATHAVVARHATHLLRGRPGITATAEEE